MAIEAVCPACMSVNELDDDQAGTKVRCDECNNTFTVPKKGKAKPRGDANEPAERVVSTGPTRQQFIGALLMAFLSLLALLVVAGLGGYHILVAK